MQDNTSVIKKYVVLKVGFKQIITEYQGGQKMKKGENIIVEYVQAAYNTSRKQIKRKNGVFIKEYNTYIQFYDKYNIRRSIMKQDLIKIERINNESI